MRIGNKTIARIVEDLEHHLHVYQEDINEAYLKADDALAITLTARLSPDKGRTKVETGISFVAEKIKDKVTAYVDEDQQDLFPDHPEAREAAEKVLELQ